MSDSLLVTLMGIALGLPLVIAFIAYAVEEQAAGALACRILMPLFWLASIGLFVPLALEGGNRFYSGSIDNWYLAYWIGGIICLVVSAIWMLYTYDALDD